MKVDDRPSELGPQQISWPMGVFAILTMLVGVVYAVLALFFVGHDFMPTQRLVV
jgi:uncharacterized integral membrane protein